MRDGEQVDVQRSASDTQTIIDDLVLQQFGLSEKPIAQVLGLKGASVFVRTEGRCALFSRAHAHSSVKGELIYSYQTVLERQGLQVIVYTAAITFSHLAVHFQTAKSRTKGSSAHLQTAKSTTC